MATGVLTRCLRVWRMRCAAAGRARGDLPCRGASEDSIHNSVCLDLASVTAENWCSVASFQHPAASGLFHFKLHGWVLLPCFRYLCKPLAC